MRKAIGNWEGTLLLFVVIVAVLTGIAYVLSINFAIPIPWLGILIAALLTSIGIRMRRAANHGASSK
jgi:hypothetical protein